MALKVASSRQASDSTEMHLFSFTSEYGRVTRACPSGSGGRSGVCGQSVPHTHVHILPRYGGDFERNDDVYDELERWSPSGVAKGSAKMDVPDDADRVDRTQQMMAEEAVLVVCPGAGHRVGCCKE